MREDVYPLTVRSFGAGAVAGAVAALLVSSALLGFAVFVLIVSVGVTWSRRGPAIFPFILAYQWFAITVGYIYSLFTGIFPSAYPPGDIERTITLSLSGLLLLTLGIRLVCSVRLGERAGAQGGETAEIGNLDRLFWVVMACYAIDYVHVINTRAYGSAAQVLARVLDIRQVLLLALWWEVLRRREHYRYLWITLAWVFVPLLGSYLSDFKTPLVLLLIVFLSLFKPWERDAWRFTKRQVATAITVAGLLVFVALVWQAGVKKETRKAYDANAVAPDPIARVSLFLTSAEANLPIVFNDTQRVVEGLVERLSYVTFFSRVLDHVPRVQPHTNGELLKLAIANAVMPRFLFPDKPELPSDSLYTRRFTGIPVTEDSTSISIGYLAEFYADWGVIGMFMMTFCYGCWIGLGYRVVAANVRVPVLVNPVLITVLMSVYQFEHQFIKTFAALNIAVIVSLATVGVLRRPLERLLDVRVADDTDAEDDSADDSELSCELS